MLLAESLGQDLVWEKAVGIKSSFKWIYVIDILQSQISTQNHELTSGCLISLLICEEPFTPTRFVWNTNMAATVSMFLAGVTPGKNPLYALHLRV